LKAQAIRTSKPESAVPGIAAGGIFLTEGTQDLRLTAHRNLSSEEAARAAVFVAGSEQAGSAAGPAPIYGERDWFGCGAGATAIIPISAVNSRIGCLHFVSRSLADIDPAARSALENIAAWLGATLSRIRADEARLESEASYRFLTENIKDVIWSMDFETLRFLYVSPSVEALRGFTPQEVMAQPLDAAVPEDVAQGLRAMLKDRLACYQAGERVDRKRLFFTEEVPQPCKDGSMVWTEVVTSFWQNPKTGRLEIHGVTRDITARRAAEEEKRLLRSQLEQAGKLEAIGRLAGGIAHDFNNMLTVILSTAELALIRSTPGDPNAPAFESIIRAAERSAEMTRQLLGFARKQSAAPRVLDLNKLVAVELAMLRRLLRENIRLDWLPGDGLKPVRLDPTQISQILTNLCVNARDAIVGSGEIALRTASVSIDRAAGEGDADRAPGEYVALSVSDTGQGMSEDVQRQIFEPFFTTKGQGRGTGLGLATVYGIVRQNGGFISVSSQPGRGSTFSVHFPVCGAAAPAVVGAPERPVELSGKGHVVLLVDDESAILEASRALIEHLGFTVLSSASPDEALALAADYPGDIHILVTDIVMPGMNGKELYSRLLQTRPWLKCLYVSGYAEGLADGAGILDEDAHLLDKPFTLRSLAEKLQEAAVANRWTSKKAQ
jgi:PAS domain S-box-containing protein